MKCATTSLFSYLAEHPAIAPSAVKEPEFFSTQHQPGQGEGHPPRVDRYEDLFDFDPDRHRYAMEASTGYSKWSQRGVPEAIHAYGLRPRLIYLVRDPFERIESHYNSQQWRKGWNLEITSPSLVQTSNYYLYATDYTRRFGRESLLLLDYGLLSRDPVAAVNQVCGFLEIPPVAAVGAARNVTRRPRSGLERRLLQLAPGLRHRVPEAVRRPVRDALAALRPGKARLSPAERRQVAETLAPDMARFGREYGVDVGRWGF